MLRCSPVAVFIALICTHSALAEKPTTDPAELALQLLRAKPVVTGNSEVDKKLRAWHADGTAAGNVGDFYDNRDGGHSQLRTAPYPQLQEIEYTEAEVAARKHYAAATRVLPGVVFGNSSTSAPALRGGSNIRQLYASPGGLALLQKQYRGNNLYIYPEHRDHDPGQFGPGIYGGDGYGDLFPVNTPYLIASQGSSGSDQPFMKALPYVLAAFRPDVKQKLKEKGLLMPTVQMLLRRTARNVKDEVSYLSGTAHPVVFEGKNVDVAAMVTMAHSITLENLPPLAQIKVTAESPIPQPMAAYFDPASEKLADLPEVVARVWRGRQLKRELTISAKDSFDLNDKPLTYHWVLLQGDPDRVKLQPVNKGESAKISVQHHPRGAMTTPAGLASNRVDIGVLVSNGSYYSPPAFITFLMLNNELRTYEDGRLIDIGYGASQAVLSPESHQKLLEAAAEDAKVRKLLGLDESHVTALKVLTNTAKSQEAKIAALREAKQKRDQELSAATEAFNNAEKALQAARAQTPALVEVLEQKVKETKDKRKRAELAAYNAYQEVRNAQAAMTRLLDAPRQLPGGSIRDCFGKLLRERVADISQLEKQRDAYNQAIQAAPANTQRRLRFIAVQLAQTGIVAPSDAGETPGVPTFTPLAKDEGPLTKLTRYERSMIEWYNAELIANILLPGLVRAVFHERYVDPRLTITKTWRDVCHYTSDGAFDGYTRHYQGKKYRIGPQGALYDELTTTRPATARVLNYAVNRNERSRNGSPEMTFKPGARVNIKYDSPEDRSGKVEPQNEAEEPKEPE